MVAEVVLEATAERRAGSSPVIRTKYGYVTRNKACLRRVTQGSTPSVKSGQESDTILKHIRFSVFQYGKSRVTDRCSLSTGRRDSLASNTGTIFKHIRVSVFQYG